jgi:hypothetical protein
MNYRQLYNKATDKLQSEQKKLTAQDRNIIEYSCRYYCEGYNCDNKLDMYNKLKDIFVDDNDTINAVLNMVLCMCDNAKQATTRYEKHRTALLYALSNNS